MDVSITSLINNLNRIRYWITQATGEALGTVSHSLTAVWAKFHASSGHQHTGATDDAPQLDHGGFLGLSDDDHTQYFLADASRKLTGSQILRSVDDAGVYFCGGSSISGKGAYCLIFGSDHATYPGRLWLVTPNAAKSGGNIVISITGTTDTPEVYFNTRRAYGVQAPSNSADIVDKNYVDAVGQAWAAWTPTLVWSTATPASVTTVARWTQAGRVVFFRVYVNSADSNGTTGLTITLPKNCSNQGAYPQFPAVQIYGAAGATYGNPLAYLDEDNNLIKFLSFQTATDGQRISVRITGFYEVA